MQGHRAVRVEMRAHARAEGEHFGETTLRQGLRQGQAHDRTGIWKDGLLDSATDVRAAAFAPGARQNCRLCCASHQLCTLSQPTYWIRFTTAIYGSLCT
jgi:hypothetical protein